MKFADALMDKPNTYYKYKTKVEVFGRGVFGGVMVRLLKLVVLHQLSSMVVAVASCSGVV